MAMVNSEPQHATDRSQQFNSVSIPCRLAAGPAADPGRSAPLVTRMRIVAILVLLMTIRSLHAGSPGLEIGNGVALTGGVAQVNYMLDKSVSILIAPSLRLGLMEVQLTFANGKTKRHSILFAGPHTLRAPMPIEFVEILGLLCMLAFVCGIFALLNSAFRFGRAQRGAAPNDGPAGPVASSELPGGPPSVR